MATYGPESFRLKNGETVIIRHPVAADFPLYPVFQQQCASETTHTMQVVGLIPEPSIVIKNWEEMEKDKVGLRLMVFHENQMIAQMGIHPWRKHPWVEHVADFGMMILKNYWGQGLGKRLLEIIEAHARRVGVTRIEGCVRVGNDRGEKLYLQAGYKIEGTRRSCALINGKMWDEFYIAKLL